MKILNRLLDLDSLGEKGFLPNKFQAFLFQENSCQNEG